MRALGITTTNPTVDFTNIQNKINGNWYGSAAVYNIPNDSYGYGTYYSKLRTYFEYYGHANSSYFNSVGTYSHATIAIAFSPSVSIDTGGNVSASIGLSIFGDVDERSAEVEVIY